MNDDVPMKGAESNYSNDIVEGEVHPAGSPEAERYNTMGIAQATQNMLLQALASFAKAIESIPKTPAITTTGALSTPMTVLCSWLWTTSPELLSCVARTRTY